MYRIDDVRQHRVKVRQLRSAEPNGETRRLIGLLGGAHRRGALPDAESAHPRGWDARWSHSLAPTPNNILRTRSALLRHEAQLQRPGH